MKILIFLLFPLFLSAQAYSNRGKGEVFKSYPEKPYEDVKKTGVIVVDKTLYGLKFKDNKLPKEVKNRVQYFGKQPLFNIKIINIALQILQGI